jgi:glycosyltransferase involved in cell wall biosynthesis
VIYRLDYGGLENGLVNLLNHLPRDRYRHAVVCLAGFGAMRDRIVRDDVQVVSIDKRPGKDFPSYLRLWKLLRTLRPDIVHTRNLGTVDLQWVAWAAGVRRRIHGEHGWESTDPTVRDPHYRRVRRACRPVIQRWVAMSRDIAAWLEQSIGVNARVVRQLYDVDTRRFRPGGEPPHDWPWAASTVRAVRVRHRRSHDAVRTRHRCCTRFAG